jgi:hypothetical protein
MANASPQAIRICNEKLRPLADRMGQLYNFSKSLQAEAQAEGWTALFPADGQAISDGADVDGRAQITNTDISTLITLAGSFITFMEQSANANRNLVLKVAVNPERI